MLDNTSINILKHLQEAYNNKNQIDSTLIDSYIQLFNKSYIFPNTETVESLENNTYLENFIPTINNLLNDEQYYIIDPGFVVVNLLEAILSYLSLNQILSIYSKGFIIRAIDSPSPQLAQMALKILKLNITDVRMQTFLKETNILGDIISKYLTNKDLPLSVVNQTELFIGQLVDHSDPDAKDQLLSKEFIELYIKTRDGKDTTLTTRLLDYIVILVPYVAKLADDNILPFHIYKFTKEDFMNNDDPLFVVLLINFYNRFIGELNLIGIQTQIFENIKDSIYDLAYLFTLRQSDSTIESFYASEIVDILSTLSYSPIPQIIQYTKELLNTFEFFRSYNLYISSSDTDIKLLSKINPDIINYESFYDDIIKYLSIFNQRYFPISLNLIKSEKIFNELVTDQRLTSASLTKLSMDMLFTLLLQFSRYKHSTKYLVNDLPTIMSNYLIDSPSEISDSEIWSLKKQTLENLLFKNDIDLNVWKAGLTLNYRVMCHGRNVKDIKPKVGIIERVSQ